MRGTGKAAVGVELELGAAAAAADSAGGMGEKETGKFEGCGLGGPALGVAA